MKIAIRILLLSLPFIFLSAVSAIAEEPLPPPPAGDDIMIEQQPENETEEFDRPHQRPEMKEGKRPGKPREGIRQHVQEKEIELMNWLDKNDPNKAKELKALKETNKRAYGRRMMFEMRNYRQIIEAEQLNPALAEVLKKDMVLKQQRNELLEQIKSTGDEAKKKELTEQLKDVLGQRFDLIVEKKQLRYEELKKKLEELQQSVNRSQAELKTIKDKKAEQVEKHLQQVLNQTEQINWD